MYLGLGLTLSGTNAIAGASNTAPVAVADSFSVDEGDTYLGVLANGLLADDTDADGDTLTLTHINGVALASGADQGSGVYRHITTGTAYVDVDADGEFGYSPGDQTLSDGFNYTISDGNGGTAIGSVSVTINGVYDLADTAITIRSTDNPNLVSNGTFDSNITGWAEGYAPATLTHDSGGLKVDLPGGSNRSAQTELTLANGTQYAVSADIDLSPGASSTYGIVGTATANWTSGRIDIWTNSAGTSQSGTFTATATTMYLHLLVGQGGTAAIFDNISVRIPTDKGNALSVTTLAGSGTITAVTGATLVGSYWEMTDYDVWIHNTTGEFFYNTDSMPHTQNIEFTRNGQTGRIVLTSPDVAAPSYGIWLTGEPPIDDFLSGTTIGELVSDMIGTISFSIIDADGLPISLSGDEIVTTGTLTAGTYTPEFRVQNTYGASQDRTITVIVSPAATGIFRGQHTPSLRPGPDGGEATYTAIDGTVLHPTGSGVYRYVDASVGSSGDGLSLANAYKTVQEGMDAASAGDTILIEPGYYPEQPDKVVGSNMANATDRIKLCRRGSGRVEIGGGDLVTGWTVCTSGDAKNNSNFANIYKATIPDTWAVPLKGAVLQQASQMAYIHMKSDGYAGVTANMFSRNDTSLFYEKGAGDATDLTDSKTGNDQTLTSATIFGGYSSGDLDDALIMMLHDQGTNTILSEIDTFDAAADEVTFDTGPVNGFNDKFAIVNSVKDISAAGQWGFEHDAGNNEYILYFWPYDNTDLTDIRLSARTRAFECSDADYWTFYGLDFVDTGGDTDSQGYGFLAAQPSLTIEGVIMRECKMGRTSNAANVGRAGYFQNFNNATVQNNTLEYVQDGGGFNLTNCEDGDFSYNLIQSIGGNGWGNAQNQRCLFSFNKISNIRSAHGNGASTYLGCQDIVWFGNIFDTGQGIGCTYQESNNLYFVMNLFIAPENESQQRALENNGAQVPVDTRNTDDFILNGVNVTMNNTVALWKGGTVGQEGSGLAYGQTPSATHHLVNNVMASNYTRAYSGSYFLTTSGTDFTVVAPANVTSNQTAVGAQTVFTTSGASNAIFSHHTTTVTVDGVDIGSAYTLTEYTGASGTSTITLDVAAADGDAVVITAVGQNYKSTVGTIDNNIVVSDLTSTELARLPGTVENLDPTALWERSTGGAYKALASGPLDGTGDDYSSLLPTGSWISGFDFERDAYGRSFDWATNPPIGALIAA